MGFDWSPHDGALYATNNGRDLLGDDYPLEELNRIEQGKFYGWPFINEYGDPDPDFAGLARAMGWYGEGPIDVVEDIQPALRRAVARVKAGQPALVDIITQRRDTYNK